MIKKAAVANTILGDKLAEAMASANGDSRTLTQSEKAARHPVITIDGLYGSGRHTLGAALATYYGLPYLNLIHVYKKLALEAGDNPAMALARVQTLEPAQMLNITYGEELQTRAVEENAHKLMEDAKLAEALGEKVSALATYKPGLIAVGTAMGRTFFPEAPVRLFLHAPDKQRQQRFAKQRGLDPRNPFVANYLGETRQVYQLALPPHLRPLADDGFAEATVSSLREAKELASCREVYVDSTNLQAIEVQQVAVAYIQKQLPQLQASSAGLGLQRPQGETKPDNGQLPPRPMAPDALRVITVDGSYGSGRETLGRRLAAAYGFNVLSQRSILFRLAAEVEARGLDPRQDTTLADELLARPVESLLNLPEVVASKDVKLEPLTNDLLTNPALGAALALKFGELAEAHNSGLVAIGTSMGREFFPKAAVRIFTDASVDKRYSRYANARRMDPRSDDVKYAVNDADVVTMLQAATALRLRPEPDYAQHTVRGLSGIGAVATADEMFLDTSELDVGQVEVIGRMFAESRLTDVQAIAPKAVRKAAKKTKVLAAG